MSEKLGKYFRLRHNRLDVCLDLEGRNTDPGAPIVVSRVRSEIDGNDTQLWYLHPFDHTIRNKATDLCIDIQEDHIVCNPFENANPRQKWQVEGQIIRSRKLREKVLSIGQPSPDEPAALSEEDESEGQKWVMEFRQPFYMYIRKASDEKKVLMLKPGKTPNNPAIVKNDLGDLSDHQLWYENQNGVLLCKRFDFALDSAGSKKTKNAFVLNPYEEDSPTQQWVRDGNMILNKRDMDQSAEAKKEALTPARKTGLQSQQWNFEEIEGSAYSMNHSGNGPKCYIRNMMSKQVWGVQKANIGPNGPIETLMRPEDTPEDDDDVYEDYDMLFYLDEVNSCIRFSANDYAVDMIDGELAIAAFDPYSSSQRWVREGAVIQHQHETQEALAVSGPDVGSKIIKDKFTGDARFRWEFLHVPANSFFVKSDYSGKLLDVKKDKAAVGAEVIMWEQKKKVEPNQLWYVDENNVIRSKLNGYVLEVAEGEEAKMMPYDPDNPNQQWTYAKGKIQSKLNPNMVIMIKPGFRSKMNLASVICDEFKGSKDQYWSVVQVDYTPDEDEEDSD